VAADASRRIHRVTIRRSVADRFIAVDPTGIHHPEKHHRQPFTIRHDRMAHIDPDDEVPPHVPQNRRTAEQKLRKGGRNCPVCLAELRKTAPKTRRMRACLACNAHPSPAKRCARCGAAAVWENKQDAACQRCGTHGAKRAVIEQPTPSTIIEAKP
jgi:hypothetical protein